MQQWNNHCQQINSLCTISETTKVQIYFLKQVSDSSSSPCNISHTCPVLQHPLVVLKAHVLPGAQCCSCVPFWVLNQSKIIPKEKKTLNKLGPDTLSHSMKESGSPLCPESLGAWDSLRFFFFFKKKCTREKCIKTQKHNNLQRQISNCL